MSSTSTAGKTDPDDIPETPKNPITRTGDLWVLGKHRIVCGDSTDQKTVERLLDGAAPDLMLTDPPYGMNYDSSWRYRSGISSKDGAFGKSTNDDRCDWTDAYGLCCNFRAATSGWTTFGKHRTGSPIMPSDNPFKWR